MRSVPIYYKQGQLAVAVNEKAVIGESELVAELVS
jgi:hypothetical protein